MRKYSVFIYFLHIGGYDINEIQSICNILWHSYGCLLEWVLQSIKIFLSKIFCYYGGYWTYIDWKYKTQKKLIVKLSLILVLLYFLQIQILIVCFKKYVFKKIWIKFILIWHSLFSINFILWEHSLRFEFLKEVQESDVIF